jgi:hypothetical protein
MPLALDDAALARLVIVATRIPRRARSRWLQNLARTIEDHAARFGRARPVPVSAAATVSHIYRLVELLAASRDCTQPTLIAGGGGRTIEVARVRITEAGRRTLARHY